jgi:GDPmannose 4,6-dehydratase
VSGDITDVHSLLKVFQNNEDVDEVYNLAAQSHVAVSFKQPGLTWDITGKGCLNVLQTIVDLELGCKFYQASSSEMFGDSYDVDKHGNKYQDENTKFLPQSPYAIAKCAAHYITRLFRESHGIHASTGILFNHEGERRGETFVTRKITKWIGEFVRSGKDENFPQLRLGNLEAYRDWGYAVDYVEAMWLMLQQPEPDDYVICTGETHTIKDLLNCAFETAGIENWEQLVTIDPEFYRPVEVDYLRGKACRAQKKLGWTPAHSFKDLVKLMVEHDINADIQSIP